MKKKVLTMMLIAAMAASICACGTSNQTPDSAEQATETSEAAESTEAAENVAEETEATEVEEVVHYEYDTPASSTFELNLEECVVSLADYSAIPVSVTAEYELTVDNENTYLYHLLNNYSMESHVEITDRDTIEEGDIVKLDYTGYLDGEAFDGGSATDQMIDVYKNAGIMGNGFIEGFTDALKGAKTGTEVDGDCTFPENYGAADLAGKEVTFHFVIKGIYRPMLLSDMTDQMVATGIGAQHGLDTVGDLKETIDIILSNAEYNEKSSAVTTYMVENSEIAVPDDYLEARLNEYAKGFADENCAPDQTLADFFTAQGYDIEMVMEDWRNGMRETIEGEIIFATIAEKEGVTMDKDDFEGRLNYLVSYYGYGSLDEMLQFYGAGDADYGKSYLEDQFLASLALEHVCDNAVVTYDK